VRPRFSRHLAVVWHGLPAHRAPLDNAAMEEAAEGLGIRGGDRDGPPAQQEPAVARSGSQDRNLAIGGRARHPFDRGVRDVVLTVLATRVVLVGFAVLAVAVFRPDALAGDLPSLWNHWDGPHFLELAAGGYGPPTDPARIVLFPLYPLTIRLGSVLLPPVWAALAIALVASVAAAIGLYRLVSLDGSRNLAKSAVLAMIVFPTAFAFVAPYSEALFLALAVWSFVAMRRDDVRLAGILGALAALTRIQGIFVLPALALEYLVVRRRIGPDFLWILFVGSGLLVYLAINQVYFGDPLHFVAVQRDTFFVRNVAPWDVLSTLASGVVNGARSEGWVTTYVAPLASIVLLGAVTVWAVASRASRPSYALYAAISLISFATLSFPISVPRYLLGVFPVFIALGSWFRSSVGAAILLGCVLLLGLFTTLFVIGHWAF
jgi:hypothetical protein